MKSLKDSGLKEDTKGIIICIISIFIVTFCVSLLFPDVRYHMILWLNNLTFNLDKSVGQPVLSNESAGSLELKNYGTW